MTARRDWRTTGTGRYESLSFDVWLVKSSAIGGQSNANDWSGRMQTHGQLRCNFAIEAQSIRVFLSLNALKTTDAELTLMAMAAIIGDRRCPVSG